ncbi:MAG: MFS transporter [bacterium]|nr:MFS transporter [bacterium]
MAIVNDIVHEKELKRGMITLFCTQIFSTLSYAILLQTLTLYGTQQLGLSVIVVTALTGIFLAFNFGLHFLGGYMGGRYISNRLLFCMSMGLQIIASVFLVETALAPMHMRLTFMMIGLAIFLTGSGLNVTCMNSMVTQLFDDPDDPKRETAFLWNYSGMNVGFFIGFSIAGYYQLHHNFGMLFGLGGAANIIAILLIAFNWKIVRDRDTYLVDMFHEAKKKGRKQFWKGVGVIVITLIIMLILIRHASISNAIISVIFVAFVIATFFIAYTRKIKSERGRMKAFVFLMIASFFFWSLYQLAPMALILFIDHNVNLNMFGITIAPQWVANINTIVIVIGGPLMALLLSKLRKKGYKVSLPLLFSIALVLIGVGFAILPIGIHLAAATGIVAFSWIFWSYILQSIGELCISPIGYAAIGKLVPRKLQNLMMGLWCMATGVAAIGASLISRFAVGDFTVKQLGNPLLTNSSYFHSFLWIGLLAIVVGIIMMFYIPKLSKLIDRGDDEEKVMKEA